MIALAIVALLVFGPDRLPKVAADAGRMIRQLRRMVSGARNDLRESLGPEFRDLDINDLNPRSFVRKHLLDPVDEADGDDRPGSNGAKPGLGSDNVAGAQGEPPAPPFDADAT